MTRQGSWAAAAAAALALNGAGCAQMMEQIKQAQAAQAGQSGEEKTPEDRAAEKAKIEGVASEAEAMPDPRVLGQRGDGLRDAGDYEPANAAYRRALELNPRDTYVLAAQATNYLRMGTLKKYSKPDGSATNDAEMLRQADKYFRRAKTLADRSIQVNPNYGTGHFVIAEYYTLVGDLEKALEKFNFIETAKLTPQGHSSSFYAWRGYVKKLKGDETAAKDDFEKAMDEAEPMEFGEYADSVLNPPKDPNQRQQFPAIVHAL